MRGSRGAEPPGRFFGRPQVADLEFSPWEGWSPVAGRGPPHIPFESAGGVRLPATPARSHADDRFEAVLRCDVYRYFPAIDHEILKADVRRRIRCERTLRLIDAIIDGSNPQEPVHRYYPGDDLFTPFERRRGLPIGNLTSQLFANVYLDGLDHFVKEVLCAKGYLRYVDDFAVFHDDPAVLAGWLRAHQGVPRPAAALAAPAQDVRCAGRGH